MGFIKDNNLADNKGHILVLKVNTDRSSHPKVFCKKGVLRNFVKFTGKYRRQGLFFNKVAGLRPATLLKKELWHSCIPVNFAKISKSTFSAEHLRATASVLTMSLNKLKHLTKRLLQKPGSGPWTRTLKNLDPEKPGINIGLKNISDFRELCFIRIQN